MITFERASALLYYEPDTGYVRRKIARGSRPAGEICGAVDGKGYSQISIDNRMYRTHRIAWLLHYGDLPGLMIDHINGDKMDNRIGNLRLASNTQNLENMRKPHADSRSGFLGVSFHPQSGKWRAQIFSKGRRHHVGLYPTPEIAHHAYLGAKRKLHEFGTI